MSVTSGFFNSINGDRRYTAEQMSAIFDGIINDGILSNVGTAFTVSATTGNVVSVGIGRAWFNSTWVYNDSVLAMTLDDSEVILDRIDAIVIEINHTESVRKGDIVVVKGTPSSSPTNPVMASTEYVHQYPLAYIYRHGDSTSISQADITSKIGTSSCPYVTGILQVQNIDNIVAQWGAQWIDWFTNEKNITEDEADAIIAEWNAWYANKTSSLDNESATWMMQMKADFEAWYATVKAVLDGDTATMLASQIVELQEKFDTLSKDHSVYDTLKDATGGDILDSSSNIIQARVVFAERGEIESNKISYLPEGNGDPSYKVGDILTTIRTDLGDEWLLCNGSIVEKSMYPLLGLLYQDSILKNTEFSLKGSDANFESYNVRCINDYIIYCGTYYDTNEKKYYGAIAYANAIEHVIGNADLTIVKLTSPFDSVSFIKDITIYNNKYYAASEWWYKDGIQSMGWTLSSDNLNGRWITDTGLFSSDAGIYGDDDPGIYRAYPLGFKSFLNNTRALLFGYTNNAKYGQAMHWYNGTTHYSCSLEPSGLVTESVQISDAFYTTEIYGKFLWLACTGVNNYIYYLEQAGENIQNVAFTKISVLEGKIKKVAYINGYFIFVYLNSSNKICIATTQDYKTNSSGWNIYTTQIGRDDTNFSDIIYQNDQYYIFADHIKQLNNGLYYCYVLSTDDPTGDWNLKETNVVSMSNGLQNPSIINVNNGLYGITRNNKIYSSTTFINGIKITESNGKYIQLPEISLSDNAYTYIKAME